MKKITKREIGIFLLGMFFMIVIQIIIDLEGSFKSFKDDFFNCSDEKITQVY